MFHAETYANAIKFNVDIFLSTSRGYFNMNVFGGFSSF